MWVRTSSKGSKKTGNDTNFETPVLLLHCFFLVSRKTLQLQHSSFWKVLKGTQMYMNFAHESAAIIISWRKKIGKKSCVSPPCVNLLIIFIKTDFLFFSYQTRQASHMQRFKNRTRIASSGQSELDFRKA